MTKSIHVQYFAILREQAKQQSETLDVACETYADLYDLLKKKHRFSLSRDMIQVAVNDEFMRLQDPVSDGARVVFIPPVAGG